MGVDLLVGIDLGTSSVKVVATDLEGRPVARASRSYPVHTPAPGFAEQDPHAWWRATCAAVAEVLATGPARGATVRAVGLAGQMHGLVAVDAAGEPVRPAIIWPDTRSQEACAVIARRLGAERVRQLTGVPVSTGFLAPSLLWLREQEPAAFGRVRSVLLPKDYLRLCLTGRHASDPSDASGTLLYELRTGAWSAEMLAALRLDPGLLPPVQGSSAVAGTVDPAASELTGLAAGVPVVTGAGDQMAGAVALGVTVPGQAAAVIGTGGQLITTVAEPVVDPTGRVQTFCHALPQRWLLLGAVLAAGQSLDWLSRVVGAPVADLVAEAARVPAGADGLLFLPYLNGVRTPHVDPQARGCFVGLRLSHTRAHLARAVLEGVAFAMRECLDAVQDLAGPVSVVCSGGGARLAVWRQIQADVYRLPVRVARGTDHSAWGAALLAGQGIGLELDVATAAGPESIVEPGAVACERYQERYTLYRALYPALRGTFAALEPPAAPRAAPQQGAPDQAQA